MDAADPRDPQDSVDAVSAEAGESAADADAEREPDRRQALAMLVAAVAGGWTVVLSAIAGLFVTSPIRKPRPDQETPVGDVTAFGPDYRAVRLQLPVEDGWYRRMDHHTLFVRLQTDGSPEVYSATCPHLGCTVDWDQAHEAFVCPCHDARFGPDGQVLGGPPPAPLTRLPAEVRETELFVRLSQ